MSSINLSNYLSIFLLQILILQNLVDGSGLIDLELDGTTPIPTKDIEGTKFVIYRKKLSWEKAYEYCYTCVGNFATFESVEAANHIRTKIYDLSTFSLEYDEAKKREEFGIDRRYWFGLRDESPTENEWKWMPNPKTDGTPISSKDLKEYPWYPKQPDHNETTSNRNEHCVGFWNPGYYYDKYKMAPSEDAAKERHTFNDFQCNMKFYFICEKTDPPPPASPKCHNLESFGRSMRMMHP